MIMAALRWVFGFLAKPLTDLYVAKLKAGNEQDRIVADIIVREAALKEKEAEFADNADARDREWWLSALPRPVMGLSVAVLVAKFMVYDKALGQWTGGTTDALSSELWWIVMTIIVAYFGGRTIEKATSVIADAIKRR